MSNSRRWTSVGFLFALMALMVGLVSAAAAGEHAIHIPLVRGGPPVPDGPLALELRPFAVGLRDVTSIKHAGDERLFATQRDGRIFIIQPDGTVLPEPFLDIRDDMETNFWEQGLLGLAFAPDFADSGVFYVSYAANPDGPTVPPLVLARFTADPASNGPVDPATRQILLTIPHPMDLHYGGDLQFGADGYLYMASGDGELVSGPTEHPNALRGWNLLGKILRLDVDPAHGDSYAIPPDNPFVGNPNYLNEIWLYGLRNPWRISFDRLNGDLYVADVGLTRWEEVNRIAPGVAGISLGWPCYQGNAPGPSPDGCGSAGDHTFPIYAYAHAQADRPCSIIGGYVYRGREMPAFTGRYLFADLCTGALWALGEKPGGEVEVVEVGRFPGVLWTTFGEDINGELYLGEFAGSERVFRLVAGE